MVETSGFHNVSIHMMESRIIDAPVFDVSDALRLGFHCNE
jgi:hypothetical protein